MLLHESLPIPDPIPGSCEAEREPSTDPLGYRARLVLVDAGFPDVARHVIRWMVARHDSLAADSAKLQFETPGGGEPRTLVLWRHLEEYREEVAVAIRFGGEPGPRVRVTRTILPHWAVGLADAPVDPRRYRAPSLVASLVQTFDAFREHSVLLSPRTCDASATGDLLDYLQDERRQMPVLVISPAAVKNRPVIDPGRLARAVAGVAHVYVPLDGRATELIGQTLGPGLECCGGAVRLYWPGLSDTDPPARHPRWDPYYVRTARRHFDLDVLEAVAHWSWIAEDWEGRLDP